MSDVISQWADSLQIKPSIAEILERRQMWIDRTRRAEDMIENAPTPQQQAHLQGVKMVFQYKRRELDWILGIDPDADGDESDASAELLECPASSPETTEAPSLEVQQDDTSICTTCHEIAY